MAEPFSYMPVLRWKAAEQDAFARLAPDVQSTICPLVEICPPGFPTDNRRTAKTSGLLFGIAHRIVDVCRESRLFIDLIHLDRFRPGLKAQNGMHPLTCLFDNIRKQQLLFPEQAPVIVPVTGLTCSHDYLRAAIEASRTSKRLCIRLTRQDIQTKKLHDQLLGLAEAARLDPPEIDIIVDLAILPRTEKPIRFLEYNLPLLNRWRSLTVLAGTFPLDLRDFKPVGRHDVRREEWLYYYEEVLQSSDIGRIAAFGDYTIQHPIYREPPMNCNPSASIRYALDDSWIVMKGESLSKKNGPGAKQWPAQAKVLTSFDEEFLGPQHCDGCRYIYEMSRARYGTGDCTSWLSATINHAMTVAALQVRNRLTRSSERLGKRGSSDLN